MYFSEFQKNKIANISEKKMFGAVQPKTPDAVLAGLQQHGAAVGAKYVFIHSLIHSFILSSLVLQSMELPLELSMHSSIN